MKQSRQIIDTGETITGMIVNGSSRATVADFQF
jgi:hypothetical protein